MIIRRATPADFAALLRLYGFLHPAEPPPSPQDPRAQAIWREIMSNPRLRYYLVETDDTVVATCTLTLIPNFTRVLRAALADAWAEGCYKVMLLTGSQREETLRFYEKAGFKRGVKTGFVAYPDTT